MPEFRPRQTKRAQLLRNNATYAERKLWRFLNRRQLNGIKFSRQMPVGPYICDFLCRERKLVIEVDGGQHCESEKDLVRTAYLEREGYRIIRFWNNEVLGNVDGVLQAIELALEGCPPPTPSRKREGHKASDILPSRLREGIEGWASE
jgi:very-short-patch-repair endonuclease